MKKPKIEDFNSNDAWADDLLYYQEVEKYANHLETKLEKEKESKKDFLKKFIDYAYNNDMGNNWWLDTFLENEIEGFLTQKHRKMTEHQPHSLSEKIIHYDSLVEENERLKSLIEKEIERMNELAYYIYSKRKSIALASNDMKWIKEKVLPLMVNKFLTSKTK